MVTIKSEVKRASNKAGLRRMSKLTRFCPRCGAELLWVQDEHGLYVAMDYGSDTHKPHVQSCPAWNS